MKFHNDLAFGQTYEKIAISTLGNGNVELPPPGKFSPWDFRHNNIAYECKADRQSARTGNLCIEYEHTNIPSGISITQADYWFYFVVRGDDYTLYKIPVQLLRGLADRPGVRRWFTDGGNSRFYLVPLNEYKEFIFREKTKPDVCLIE
jgi:hypothetical protein